MNKKEIQIGDTIGFITIIKRLPNKNGAIIYLTKCKCGENKIIYKGNLIKSKYLKCYCNEKYKIGLSKSPLYRVWYSMIQRCYNEKRKEYKWYGAKGINVCNKWNDKKYGYINFYKWAIENGYKEEKLKSNRNKFTLDRIDNKKGYYPSNCRWVEYETQMINRKMICTNKSGYTGVSWSKQERKWVCVISINNKSVRIGGYKTQKEAVEKRNNYIKEHNLPHQQNVYIGELSYGY